ncbi:hypothetical protein D9758_014954 [Tetrapyrgos nigripes]|uniref:Uncharacterized protein n=1 Tax=Tetrapyrgos nigripes TaxID=182062 RepID=A0A8H5CKD1_9AGAR|nr:hypothetical protein D9758_014954 [Tetrapyrgos nigripes]
MDNFITLDLSINHDGLDSLTDVDELQSPPLHQDGLKKVKAYCYLLTLSMHRAVCLPSVLLPKPEATCLPGLLGLTRDALPLSTLRYFVITSPHFHSFNRLINPRPLHLHHSRTL